MGVKSRFVQIGDVRTHYLESMPGDSGCASIVLIHSGEFGGRSEFSWRYNIAELGKYFHVYAPDLVGFGRTELVYNFSDPLGFRMRHFRRFVETLRIGPAHLIGNSYGGGFVLQLAAQAVPECEVRSVVVVSGGGKAPDNDSRKVLTAYNGNRDEMRNILKILFFDERWWSDDMVEERWKASREPGSWEACAAVRLAPEGKNPGFRPVRPDYGKIQCPVLIVAGAQDLLRFPNYAKELQKEIPGSRAKIYDRSRHCSHIEHADSFNELAINFFNEI